MDRRQFLTTAAAASALLPARNLVAKVSPPIALLDRADRLINEADTKEKVAELVGVYKEVLELEPDNYEALWSLGRYCGLMGLAYSDTTEEMDKWYCEASYYSLKGLTTNPGFKARIDAGEKIASAMEAVTAREIAALFYWNAGRVGVWNFCMNPLEQLFRGLPLMRQTRKVNERMMDLDPLWDGGHPYFAWAIYYAMLPKILGGDMDKAPYYFDKAVEAGPRWLYIRFGRAEYYHLKKGDRKAFIEDMEWVCNQDPKKCDSPYPADVHFQKRAKEMLEGVDRLFK